MWTKWSVSIANFEHAIAGWARDAVNYFQWNKSYDLPSGGSLMGGDKQYMW